MDVFAQKKILIRLVGLLIIINITTIAFCIWQSCKQSPTEIALFPKIEPYKELSGVLQKELNLTTQQTTQIQKLRNDFFAKEIILAKKIKAEKDSMNMSMFNKVTDETLVKNLAQKISDNEYQMEMLRFEQAKQMKAICTPEQLEKFENLVKEIRDYFRPDNQPNRKENFNKHTL